MIVAALEELYKQIPDSPRLKQALDYIGGARGQALADGRYEIQGQELYALAQSYQTIPADENAKFEAHRRYIDVQYLVDGVEGMGWAPLDQMRVNTPYNPEKDVILGTCPSAVSTLVKVAAGQAAIFFPEDAHAPKLAAGEPCSVKKIVVKVFI
jgi:YhcH/YjgK/YiaL family protein